MIHIQLIYLNKTIGNNEVIYVVFLYLGRILLVPKNKIRTQIELEQKPIILCFAVNIVSSLMPVSGSFSKRLTQILTGFLKACYYDYSLCKCADRE